MNRDETGTMALVRSDFERMRDLCLKRGGEVLKNTGDGLLLSFSSVVEAVACALAIQGEFANRSADSLRHRIGIHLGDMFLAGGDVSGDGVNIAARLEGCALPGTICVSQSVYDAVKGKLPLHARSLGLKQLKNIAEPIHVYLLAPQGVSLPGSRRQPGWRRYGLAAGVGLVALAAIATGRLLYLRKTASGVPTAMGSVSRESSPLLAEARSIYTNPSVTPDGLARAEQLALAASNQDPSSADALAACGYINYYFYLRGWDSSSKRLEAASSFANQALSLDHSQPEALLTVAYVVTAQRSDDAYAESLFRRAIQLAPQDNRARHGLSMLLGRGNRDAEAISVLKEAARVDPNDALAYYGLASSSFAVSDFSTALQEVDNALRVHPFSSAWVLKAIICAQGKGDLAKMGQALQQVSPADRSDDRFVYTLLWCALLRRDPAGVLEASKFTLHDYFDDRFIRAPKAWYVGKAHALMGNENLAQLDYAEAEGVIRKRLEKSPNDAHDRLCLAVTLALRGQLPEARAALDPFEAAFKEQPTADQAQLLAMYYAAVGNGSQTAYFLRHVDDPFAGYLTMAPSLMRVDPWYDKVRGQPEFGALLTDPTYYPTARR